MFENFWDFGFELDPEGKFPGLTDKQRKEWRKNVILKYAGGPGIFPASYIFAVCVTAFYRPEGLAAYGSVFLLTLMAVVVIISVYSARRDTLERRQLVLMASTIKWIRQ